MNTTSTVGETLANCELVRQLKQENARLFRRNVELAEEIVELKRARLGLPDKRKDLPAERAAIARETRLAKLTDRLKAVTSERDKYREAYQQCAAKMRSFGIRVPTMNKATSGVAFGSGETE